MIQSIEQLCAHVGVPDFDSLKKGVYEGTTCGAWVKEVPAGRAKAGRREVSVTVLGMPSLSGWTVHALRVDGRMLFDIGKRLGRSEEGTLAVDKVIPEEVLTFLCAAPQTVLYGRKVYTCDQVASEIIQAASKSKGGQGDGFKVDRYRCWQRIRFTVWTDIYRAHRGGVDVGSIVEGSEASPETRELRFPFPAEAWGKALAAVELEADELWYLTNGCPACGPVGERGGRAINSACPSCHGGGMVR